MARFRGAGTGANRGWWVMQPRDAKKRWIEEFGVGTYSIGNDKFTGQVVGITNADSIDVERRTKNGSPTEATVDTIHPSTIEMMDVKALLDKAPGMSDEQMDKARNSNNNRPKAGSYPTGTVFTSDDGKYTKQGDNSWSDADGNSLDNKQMDERLEGAESSSAEVPEDAELTKDNILNATDGSQLTWNNKQYSRLDGKWYDEKTGKPVTDKTMRTKTDGDLSTEGGKESFTPTPASEYEPGTKLRAENDSGDDSADLEKTADNSWDVETGESSTSTDDATTDRIIESADYLDDLSDFLQNPTESEPTTLAPSSPKQLEDELDAAYKDWTDLDVPKYDDDENPIPLTDDERAELERIRGDLERISADSERFEDPEDARYAEGIKKDADNAVDDINSAIENNSRADAPATEENEAEKANEPPRVEVETDTDESVDERIETLRSEIDRTDDKEPLEDIERELAELDNQLKYSENNDDVIARERIAEARAANNEKYALIESREESANRTDDDEDDDPLAELDKAIDDGSLRKAKKGVETLNKVNGKDDSGVSEVSQEEFDALESPVMYRGVSKEEHKDAYYDDVKLGNGGNGEGVYFSDDKSEARRFANGDASSDNKMIEAKLADDAKVVTGDELLAEVEALPEDKVSADYVRSLTPTEQAAALGYDAVQVERNGDTITIVTNPSKLVSPQRDSESETDAPEPEVDDIDALPEPEEELPEEDVDTSGYDPDAEDEDIDWDSEENPLDAEPAPEEAPAQARPVDDILSDLQEDGAYASEQVSKAASGDSTANLDEADARLRERAIELNEARENASGADRRKIDASTRQLRQAQSAIQNARDNETEQEWTDVDDQEGISEVKSTEFRDGAVALVFKDDDTGRYGVSAYPPASDTDIAGGEQFETPEEAQQYARRELAAYDPVAASRPETHSEEDLANGHQADPQPVDEAAAAPDVEQVKQANQDAAENGTFDITEVDSGADFTETSDITERRENASKLRSPEIGDTTVTASGRTQEYVGGGIWKTIDAPVTQETSNETQKKLNKAGPEPIRVGSAGEPVPEAPVSAPDNKHGIDLKNGPSMIRATLSDGTEVTFQKTVNGWHRRLDNEGNLAPSPIKRNRLNDFLNNADQVASVEPARTVRKPKVKETPAPEAPQEPKEQGLTKGGKNKHKASGSDDRTPLGSDITDKITSGEPGTLLTQNGNRVGYVGPDGTPYYVGDRIIYQDRSKRTRSARIAAIGAPDKNGNYRLDTIPDEHDILASENKMPYDTWRGLSDEDRVAAGMSASKYSNVASVMSHKFAQNKVRHAQNENREDVNAEHQRRKEEGKVTGVNVEIPEFLPEEEVSRDRVYRDESTRIIGTLNKHGELFKPGEVVTYGPNNEVGTIVRVGEADDVIRIAPNGQSALEAQHYHVDTIAHSNKPATYYDENYDVPASERVIYDRFNDPVRVGDTIYRYGLPFTVKDIYPDGRKMRVVGQDWAGEQGATPAVQFSKLIDMGMDEELAKTVSSESEHDFMPEHLQLFTGDVNDIRSIRTHDSHMWSMVRDDQGRVIESHPENRAAAQTRATGNRNDQKILNAQWARDMAERPEDEVRLEYTGIQPGQFIDQVFGQAISDNYSHYIEVTFGTDMVIPDNSRLVGQDRFGNPEFYIKKNNRWRIEGIEDDDYEMSAAEFGRYRMRTAYDPGKDFEGDIKQRRKGLVYMGDADEEIAPKPGQQLSKKDAATFKLMPIGSVVRFVDAEGNIITIRKGPDGEWYKVTQSGAWAGNAKPVDFSKLPGKATYRGPYNRQAPLPAKSDRSSEAYEKNNVQRQKLRQERNATRRGKGGEDRIYGSHITGEGTYRDSRENSDNVRDSRIANEQLAAENERLAAENQAAQEKADQEAEARRLLEEQMRQMQEEMRRLRGETDDEGTVTASGDRIIATRKGTDHVLAVYNRVDGNVWEYTSSKGYRREFTMENVPSTPGVTYKVEEKTA